MPFTGENAPFCKHSVVARGIAVYNGGGVSGIPSVLNAGLGQMEGRKDFHT